MTSTSLSRRAFLAAVAAVPVAAAGSCSTQSSPRKPSGSLTSPRSAAATVAARWADLEARTGRRMGAYVLDTGSRRKFTHRADEPFAMCSTYKPLVVAAVLADGGHNALARRIRYRRADLADYSPVTSKHVSSGMTIEKLCSAAMRYSDNTAANLLLAHVGGPAEVTAYLRRIGDTTTRLDRSEPQVNTAIPGDPRDTTTPRSIATDYLRLATADILETTNRRLFTAWLRTNTTGDEQIRAGLPGNWIVGDKTGAGDYGTTNDVAVIWPPGRAPIAMAIMTTSRRRDASSSPPAVAAAAKLLATVL